MLTQEQIQSMIDKSISDHERTNSTLGCVMLGVILFLFSVVFVKDFI